MRDMAKKPRRRKLRFIDPLLVSIPEFGRISGLGPTKVRELVADGTLPHRVIGNRAWILRAQAVAWLCEMIERRPAA
jgi:hypothetical protein